METIETTTDLEVDKGTMAVVTYSPADGAPRPAVVLVHDTFGLTRATLDIAKGLAEEGFVVAAPDVFHRFGRMKTAPRESTLEEQRKLRAGMTNDGHVADMNALARHLQAQPYVQAGLVGIVGFCLGGRIAYLAASQGEGFGPAVLFYPTRLLEPDPAVPGSPMPIVSASGVKSPLLAFFPELDSQNSPENIARIRAALAGAPAEIVVVEGADHGFAQPAHEHFHTDAGPRAWRRAIEFFVTQLQGAAVR